MTWKVSDPMSEKLKLVVLYQSGQRSMKSICQELSISRKTGYKLLKRYKEEGPAGLKERSRAPHVMPRQTPSKMQDLIIAARKAHPTWGPRKLKAWMEDRDSSLELPYPSTIGDLLKREGLVHPRRRRFKTPVAASPPSLITQPNQEWCVDFKGEFRLGSGSYCYPLTVTDAFSRYLLEVRALEGTAGAGVRSCFVRRFREFGLPQTIRSDNGSPFASIGVGRLSALSVWWIKLGIRPVRGRPHHPQDNPRHERMHRTLKAETTRPPSYESRGQQRRFDAFQKEFNHVRPHEALGQKPPARIYQPSVRPYPSKIADIEYPGHYEVRNVCKGGTFTWRGQGIFISESLTGERIGLKEVDEGIWRVYFANLEIGVLDQVLLKGLRTGRVLPMSPV
ncbi:MAG TPA: IS481 family transposase [Planctomycetota bacterium]|jgi:transposase InsO family protein